MRRRTWRSARLPALVLPILALLTAALRAQAETQRSLQQSWYSRSEPFSHRWHVPDLWHTLEDQVNDPGNVDLKAPPGRPVAPPAEDARLLGETRRDCRGCHGYEAGKERDPQAVCAQCHYRPDALERDFDKGFERDLAPLRRRGPRSTPWAHQDHLAIGCRACHEPADRLSGRMPVIEGTALCFRCHQDRADPANSAWLPKHLIGGERDVQRPEWLRDPAAPDGGHGRFLARLNAHPSMGPEGFERFRHKEHLPTASRNDQTSCEAACHRGVSTANAQALGAATVGQESLKTCSSCHAAKAPDRLEFTLAPVERQSPSALTFQHADHFKAKDPINQKDLPGACSRCHVYNESRDGDEYPLVPEFSKRRVYDACVACHYHAEKHRLPDHGEVAGCAACHALGDGRPMASNRPEDPVVRVRPMFFLVERQSHPFLTESKGPREKACFDKCHRMQDESLPSRVAGRRFDHRSHLPAKPAASDCQPCHGSVPGTKGPADLLATYDTEAPAVAGQLAQPDPKVCGKCHLGSAVVAQIADGGPPRAAPRVRFPHDRHLGPRTKATAQLPAMDCVTCHVPAAGYGADVGTTAEALACKPCHQHEAWNVEITGKKDKAYVTTCGQCHTAGVPADDGVVMASTQRIQGQRGTQTHERGPGCSCHRASQETERPEETPHVRARLRSVHAGEKDKPKNCLGCHWEMNLVGALDFSFVTGTQAFRDFRDQKSRRKLDNPPKRPVRSFVGGELEGYPGRDTVK